MKFILEKEKREAERKIIEAEGIAKAQQIIAQQLNDRYLTWRFLEKIETFGKGPNNAIILLPYDQKIIPLIQVPYTREEKYKTKDLDNREDRICNAQIVRIKIYIGF